MEMPKEQKAECWDLMKATHSDMIEKHLHEEVVRVVQELMEATEKIVKEASCSMN